MLSRKFPDEFKAKEIATGLALIVTGVSWCTADPMRGLDPLPAGLSQAQIDAINEVVAAHVYSPPVTPPDVAGFKVWLKVNMTFALRNSVAKTYPNFMGDLNAQQWDDFQAGCIIAKADVPLTNEQWTAFKNACTTYNIPVTL